MALTCLFTGEQTALRVLNGPLVRKLSISAGIQNLATERGRSFLHIFLSCTGDFHHPSLPLLIVKGLRKKVFQEAGRFKATYRISLADSIALAEAKSRQVPLVTCDHHELDIIDRNKELTFYWIR